MRPVQDHPDGSGVTFAVGLSMVNVGFYAASTGVVLVVLAGDLGVPVESLAWFGSTFGYGLFLVAIAGPAVLRLGPGRVLAGAAALLGAGSLLLALSAVPGLAYTGAVLQGIGASGMVLVAPRLLRGPQAAVKLTRVNAAASVAGVCAPLLLGAAASLNLGGRLPLVLIAAAMAVLLVAALRMAPVAADPPPATGEKARPLARGIAARRWLALVCSVSVEFCFVVWGVARLSATGLDTGSAALVGAAFPIGMALGRLVAPRLISRLPMLLVGSVLAGVGSVLVVVSEAWPLVAAGQLLAGFGIATFYPITLARLMATPGLRPEFGASLGALGSGTAITVAPAALAGLAVVLDLRLAFLVALPLLGLLLWLHREPASVLR